MLKGIDLLTNTASVTLAPKGCSAVIRRPQNHHNGVTVSLKDKFDTLGTRLIQDVTSNTNEVEGDGTTTATVLARAIYIEGVKNVAAGCNPWTSAAVHKSPSTASSPSSLARQNLATISANGDVHIGNLLAQAMEKVGKEDVGITEGMRLDRSYISPYYTTDVKTQKVEFEKPMILRSKKIRLFKDMAGTIGQAYRGFGERKDMHDDALNAARAAVEEGILLGGGVALLTASLQLATASPSASASSTFSLTSPNAPLIPTANSDQELGVAIVRCAITTPIRTILANAGEESSVVVGALLTTYVSEYKFWWGYDAAKGEYVDMVERGIVPTQGCEDYVG
ncbi:GroEL equatorial domain-like protein [Coprinopsis marcescibilis]|uniref:GroEL equatorial domain-like protein n=1 Tax=Coprinopsis marcescibilis TaxID=230819 RepID=A0A5C3KE01_COPMA|nr:GroEL equatorial domain-like protein [Coprinopsis marcescibilis]